MKYVTCRDPGSIVEISIRVLVLNSFKLRPQPIHLLVNSCTTVTVTATLTKSVNETDGCAHLSLQLADRDLVPVPKTVEARQRRYDTSKEAQSTVAACDPLQTQVDTEKERSEKDPLLNTGI